MTAPIKGMGCIKCMYFEKTDANYGECRRYAPHPNPSSFVPKINAVGTIKTDIHWPKVYDNNWCGQFAGRKPEQVATNTPQSAAARPRTVAVPTGDGGSQFKLAPEIESPDPAPPIDLG